MRKFFGTYFCLPFIVHCHNNLELLLANVVIVWLLWICITMCIKMNTNNSNSISSFWIRECVVQMSTKSAFRMQVTEKQYRVFKNYNLYFWFDHKDKYGTIIGIPFIKWIFVWVIILWSEDCFYYCSERNNVVVLFGTLKVQSFILTEVSDCGLLIVITSSTFLKRKDMLKEKSSQSKISSRLLVYIYTCVLCTHIRIYVYQDLVHLDSSGPPGVSSRLLGSHPSTPSVQCVCVCAYTHTHAHIHSHPR